MAHVTPVLDQIKFRGRDDDVSLNSTTFNGGGGLNGDWEQDSDVNFRCRFEVNETAGGSLNNQNFNVWFKLNAGSWTQISGTTAIQWAATTRYADLDASTQVLGSATFLTGDGFDDSNGPTRNVTYSGNDTTELEICLTIDSGQVSGGDAINLRVYQGGSVIDAYAQEPTITVRRIQVAGPIIRPDGDISNAGSWTTEPLWSDIDEVSADDDTTFISATDIGKVCEVRLEKIADPLSSAGHDIFIRARIISGTGSITVSLYDGGTLRASLTTGNLTTSYANYSYTLSAGEANAITDYDDLRLRITYSGLLETCRVTQAFFDTGVTGGAALVEVHDEVEEIDEGTLAIVGLIKAVDEVEEISEGTPQRMSMVRVEDEIEEISEGVPQRMAMVRIEDEVEEIAEGVPQRMAMTRVTDETEEIAEGTPHRKAMVRVSDDDVDISEGIIKLLGILAPLIEVVDDDVEIAEGVPQRMSMVRIEDEDVNISEEVLEFKDIILFLNETVNLTENVNRARIMVRVLDETEQIAETRPRLMNMVRLLNESGDLTEDTIHTLAMVRILDETENITEATLALRGLLRIIDEVENIAEDVVDIKGIVKFLNESVNLTEDVVRARVMVRILSEVESLVEGIVRTGLNYKEVLNEIVAITDSLLQKTDTMPYSTIAGASRMHGVIDVMRDVIVNKSEQIAIGEDAEPELLTEAPSEPLWERFFPANITLILNYGDPLYTNVDLPRIQNDANVPDGTSFLYDDRELGCALRFDLNEQQNILFAKNDDRMVVYVSGQQRVTGVPPLVNFAWRFNGSPVWGSVGNPVPVGGPAPPYSTFVFDETVGFFFGLAAGVSLDISKIDFFIGVTPQGSGVQKRNFDIDSFSMWLKIVPPDPPLPEPEPEPPWEDAPRELGTEFDDIVTRTTLYKAASLPTPATWTDKGKEPSTWTGKAKKASTWTGKTKRTTPWEDK